MASKATHRKTTVDVIKQQKKNAKRLAGQARQSASGVSAAASSTTSLAPSSQGSSAGANIASYLRTAGDTMIGPLAFWRSTDTTIYPSSSNNNTLDISSSTGAYSSHVIWFAAGSNTLEIISGAAFNGQILFLESTQTLTQTIKDRSNTSGGNTGNIKTLDGNDLALGTDKTIVLLMYSDIDGFWHQVSNPTVSSGGASLSGTNNWTGVNTFAANVSMNGATTTIGDNANDVLAIYSKMGTNLNMSTYDITGICRLEFDLTGTDTLANTATGIDATSSKMHFNVPTGDAYSFTINGVEKFWVGVSQLDLKSQEILNVGTIDSDVTLDDNHRIKATSNDKIGFQVSSNSITVGDYGTIQLPYIANSSGSPANSTLDGWFGNANGCIGIQYEPTGGTHRIWFRSNGGWVKNFGT